MTKDDRIAKQVIVMRKDLGMRKGKMIAQGAHASLGVVLMYQCDQDSYSNDVRSAFNKWLTGSFTKICVSVNSGVELIEVYRKAILAGIPAKLVIDAGHTEFHGEPTMTCLALGPAWSDDIDKITGELKLL